jgi:cobalt/nickel transport system permease protein
VLSSPFGSLHFFDALCRRGGWLHRRDPRAKLLALLLLLAAIGVAPFSPWPFLALGGAVTALAASARLPLWRLAGRALWVLPFTAVFGLVLAMGGQPGRAAALTAKAVLSAFFVLLLMSTTPLEAALAGLQRLGVPAFLAAVAQFVWRYLFVAAAQAQRMRWAALARGSQRAARAAAGAVSGLFARSYLRAEGVHRAMLARGFSGSFPDMAPLAWRAADAWLLLGAAGLAATFLWGGRP